jgi:hypothetical protein
MALTLVVSEAFGIYDRGDVITDPTTIASIRSGELATRVVQVSDVIVPPPPPTTGTSALQALVNQIALLTQRVEQLEAAPPGGGGDPDPDPGSQLAGSMMVDADGTLLLDADGQVLVR